MLHLQMIFFFFFFFFFLYTESPNSLIIVLSMYRPDTALEYLKRIFKWYSTELFSLKCLSIEQCFDPFLGT